MKGRFTTVDIIAVLSEMRHKVLGMRVVNVYDIDHKTYLIKVSRSEEKAFILFESGVRIHLTEFEWPKNMMPSGFSMKCRKHLKSRRVVSIEQLGVDRIVDIQFGSDEAAYHLIIELYDKGNIILTDYQYVILTLLRTRTDQEAETRFAVRELYPVTAARQPEPLPSASRLAEILGSANVSDQLKKVLMPQFVYGPALLSHALFGAGLGEGALIGDISEMLPRLQTALEEADMIFQQLSTREHQGCIIQRREGHNDSVAGATSDLILNVEFHPMKYRQHEHMLCATYESFNKAVDEFFSKLSSQKIDVKLHQQEKTGLQKLENVRKDHSRRLQELQNMQTEDSFKAELIEMNIDLVTKACDVISGAIATAMDWGDIVTMVKEARSHGDQVACAIHELQLEKNHMILLLRNPYEDEKVKPIKVDIDLDLTAYANARRYYDHKKFAATKQQKTIDASAKALKSAERKTRQAMKEASKVATIRKARKVYWFEKFFWFISSENYLIIGGRDQQQNELIVKKYLNDGDIYVHADLHGASSIVIKNPTRGVVPARTLSEAANMATCYSSAWEAKVTTSVWWVWHHQVSKTAPSGEYLTTGSFMIRGKKNYLPPTSQLMLCFGFMFKLDDSSVANHRDDRKTRSDDDTFSMVSEEADAIMETVAMSTGSSDSSDEGEHTIVNNSSTPDVAMVTFPDTIIGIASSDYRPSEHQQSQRGAQPKFKDVKRQSSKDGAQQKNSANKTAPKRGQKYKQKKIKERYKDQDDSDRQLHMQLLASAGEASSNKGGGGKGNKKRGSRNTTNNPKHKYYYPNKSTPQLVFTTNKQHDPVLASTSTDHVTSPSPDSSSLVSPDPSIVDNVTSPDPSSVDHVTSHDPSTVDHVTSPDPSTVDHVTSPDPSSVDHVTSPDPTSMMSPDPSSVDRVTSSDPMSMTSPDASSVDHVTSPGDIKNQDHEESDQSDENDKDDVMSLLDTLTGCPNDDDVILFAVPVCAPYMAMTNYKFKVRIIPGMQRRGKGLARYQVTMLSITAARTALHNFMHSKEITMREKDLLLTVKDNDLSRYFPGKVKMLALPTVKSKHKQ